MRAERPRIMLLGATGLVGRHVLTRLLADDRVGGVVAPVRRPLPADIAGPSGRLQAPVVDFDRLPDAPTLWAVDAVICALGTTMRQAGSQAAFERVDMAYPLAISARALQAGARAFALTSATGANAGSRIFYNRIKGQLEDALRAQDWPSLALVRPGLIGGQREGGSRPAEAAGRIVLGMLAPVLPRRWRISPADRIAAVLVEHALAAAPGCRVVEAAALA